MADRNSDQNAAAETAESPAHEDLANAIEYSTKKIAERLDISLYDASVELRNVADRLEVAAQDDE